MLASLLAREGGNGARSRQNDMHKARHPARGSLVAHADLIVVDDDTLKDLPPPTSIGG
jgi:hypothetical protein